MTVVLVHGNPETTAVWDPLVDRLRERGHTDPVRLAPPGFGAPLPPGFQPTAGGYRDWLTGELEAIGEPVDLVGHDWGGLHVAGVAMQRPDLLRSWASDALGALEPDYEWHPLAQLWQAAPAGEQWVEQQLALSLEERTGAFAGLGIAEPVAGALAAGFDRRMGETILALYRASRQPVLATLGRGLEAAAARPGLAILAHADDNVGTDGQRWRAAQRAHAVVRGIEAGHWWMTADDGRPGAELLGDFWETLA